MTAGEPTSSEYDPSYREKDVDDTLHSHEKRLTRLERGMYILSGFVIGIAANEAPEALMRAIGIII